MTAPVLNLNHLTSEPWLAAGASAIGTSHVADEKLCQDAHGLRALPGGGFVAAVADGAGSAERSEIGARLAVDAALAALARHLGDGPPGDDTAWRALMAEAFKLATEALAGEATERGLPLRQLSATLLVAVVHPQRCVVAGVGDCVAVAQADNGEWLLPLPPARGEYANETTFLTSPGWAAQLQVEFLAAPPTRLALFSDGLLRLALNVAAATPHAPFFNSLFAFLTSQPSLAATTEALGHFLESDRVNARTDDDKTLLIAWRPPSA